MERTRKTICWEIKEKLAAYPNSEILFKASQLVDELLVMELVDMRKMTCARGFIPKTEICNDCGLKEICPMKV